MRFRLRRPSPALALSVIALLVALGGSGYAAVTINGSSLKNNSVAGKKLKNRTITRRKVKKRTLTGSEIKNHALGTKQLKAPERYHEVGAPGEPVFKNGAHNFGGSFSTTAFFKDLSGVVHLKGTLSAGNGTVAFTLPPHYRPSQTLDNGVIASGVLGYVYIRSNGDVEVHGPSGPSNYGLDPLSFRATH